MPAPQGKADVERRQTPKASSDDSSKGSAGDDDETLGQRDQIVSGPWTAIAALGFAFADQLIGP